MANHKSAIKRIRQTAKRYERNKHDRTRLRTVIKTCREALEGEDADDAREKFRAAERSLRTAASKGLVTKAHASRRVSRLAKRLDAMGSAAS